MSTLLHTFPGAHSRNICNLKVQRNSHFFPPTFDRTFFFLKVLTKSSHWKLNSTKDIDLKFGTLRGSNFCNRLKNVRIKMDTRHTLLNLRVRKLRRVCESRDRCYDFLNIFAEKFSKKLAFFTQNKAKLCKILITTLVFEKNANFFAENCRKSQKIVIITATPGSERWNGLGPSTRVHPKLRSVRGQLPGSPIDHRIRKRVVRKSFLRKSFA
jgi:hypothetical protein